MVSDTLKRLGPYELIRRLPRPGRAEVYVGSRVVHVDPGSVTAEWPDLALVKVLRPPEDPAEANEPRVKEALARFIEEGRLGMRLRHPAITRTYGLGLDRDLNLHFIVQEYLEGASLAQVLAHQATLEEPLPYRVVLQLVIPLLKALHHAHHDALREDGRPLRVVHRDIKPANAMLTWDGRVLLLDFAAARSTSFTRQETVQDVLVGTAHYLAPEQVFDPSSVSHATDIFATSVILYELCTLSPLLPRTRRYSEVAEALAKFNLADCMARVDSDRYPGLAEVLAQGLSPDPRTRFLTAGEMARELEGLLLAADTGPSLQGFAQRLRSQLAGDDEPRPRESGPAATASSLVTGERMRAGIRTTGTGGATSSRSSGPGPRRPGGTMGPAGGHDRGAPPEETGHGARPSLVELLLAALIGFVAAVVGLYVVLT